MWYMLTCDVVFLHLIMLNDMSPLLLGQKKGKKGGTVKTKQVGSSPQFKRGKGKSVLDYVTLQLRMKLGNFWSNNNSF